MTSNHRDSDSNVTFHIPPNFLMLLEQIGYKVINNTIKLIFWTVTPIWPSYYDVYAQSQKVAGQNKTMPMSCLYIFSSLYFNKCQCSFREY
jgi:hypothetical protein